MDDKQSAVFPLKAAYAFANERGLGQEVSEIRDLKVIWDRSYDSTVRRGYMIHLFEQQNLLQEFESKYWPQGATPSGKTFTQRCLRIRQEFADFLAGQVPEDDPLETSESSNNEIAFELEYQLRDFIVGNLSSIPVRGKHLSLYVGPDGRRGVEYRTGVGSIDILAKDQDGSFVVFELKRATSPDHAIGQVARYMGWVRQEMATGKDVYGVIVAKSISEKLQYAIQVMPGVSLFEYEVQFRLEPADNPGS